MSNNFMLVPLGVRPVSPSPLANHLRLLVGWNPTTTPPHDPECDACEVERFAPHSKSFDELAKLVRELACGDIGTWFCIQWWKQEPHAMGWNRYPPLEMCLAEAVEFESDGTIRGSCGALPCAVLPPVKIDRPRKSKPKYRRRRRY